MPSPSEDPQEEWSCHNGDAPQDSTDGAASSLKFPPTPKLSWGKLGQFGARTYLTNPGTAPSIGLDLTGQQPRMANTGAADRWGMRLFVVGLAFILSPVVAAFLVGPIAVLLLMIAGLACAGFGFFLLVRS